MDKNEFCELLIVSHNEQLYIVEAPIHEAREGNLVEFAPISALVLGEVVDKLFCAKDSSEYRCISKINTIHPARRIYKVSWEAWEGNDEEGGI